MWWIVAGLSVLVWMLLGAALLLRGVVGRLWTLAPHMGIVEWYIVSQAVMARRYPRSSRGPGWAWVPVLLIAWPWPWWVMRGVWHDFAVWLDRGAPRDQCDNPMLLTPNLVLSECSHPGWRRDGTCDCGGDCECHPFGPDYGLHAWEADSEALSH